jgi:hypothetical protein
MTSRLSQSELQEITRLLEQGKALPEKYRDVLFVDQQLNSEDSTPPNPEPTALEERPIEAPQPNPNETNSTTAFVRFLLDDPQIEVLIREYEDKVRIHTGYNRNQLATLTAECVNEIGMMAQILNNKSGISGFLSRWTKRTELPAETSKELFYIIQQRFKGRETEMIREQKAKEDSEEIEGAERLIKKYAETVNIFLDIAERKVSVLDEYGDERIHLLDREVDDCFVKMAGREGKNELELRKDLRKYGSAYHCCPK